MSVLYRGDYYPEYEPLEFQIKIVPIITNDEWIYLLRKQKIKECKEYLEKCDSPIEEMNKIIKEVDQEMDLE